MSDDLHGLEADLAAEIAAAEMLRGLWRASREDFISENPSPGLTHRFRWQKDHRVTIEVNDVPSIAGEDNDGYDREVLAHLVEREMIAREVEKLASPLDHFAPDLTLPLRRLFVRVIADRDDFGWPAFAASVVWVDSGRALLPAYPIWRRCWRQEWQEIRQPVHAPLVVARLTDTLVGTGHFDTYYQRVNKASADQLDEVLRARGSMHARP